MTKEQVNPLSLISTIVDFIRTLIRRSVNPLSLISTIVDLAGVNGSGVSSIHSL